MGIVDLLVFVSVTICVYGLAFDIGESIETKVTFCGPVYRFGVCKNTT